MQAENAGASIYCRSILVSLALSVLGLGIYIYRVREKGGEYSLHTRSINGDSDQPKFFELKVGEVHLCGAESGLFERILQPTVPRSGNTFSRFLLENLTGIATEAVYGEGGTFSNRSRASGRPCGVTNDCDHIHRSSGNELVIIKTHFPFMAPEFAIDDCVSKILMTVRHPVDNYFAWATYSGEGEIRTLEFRKAINFKEYFRLWEAHHNFWHAFASRYKVPLLQYRYEDLCQNPGIVFRKVSEFLAVDFRGTYDHSSKFRNCFLKNTALPKAASIISQDDLDMVALSTSHLLDQFGYRQHLQIEHIFSNK